MHISRRGTSHQAVMQYEKFIASPDRGLLWEPQQRWIAAHYTLASDDLALGKLVEAKGALDPLVALWSVADPDCPLRKQAFGLRDRLK